MVTAGKNFECDPLPKRTRIHVIIRKNSRSVVPSSVTNGIVEVTNTPETAILGAPKCQWPTTVNRPLAAGTICSLVSITLSKLGIVGDSHRGVWGGIWFESRSPNINRNSRGVTIVILWGWRVSIVGSDTETLNGRAYRGGGG